MKWYAINKEYVNYLKQFDAIVPNVDYTGKLLTTINKDSMLIMIALIFFLNLFI